MTQAERDNEKAKARLGIDSPFVEVTLERAAAYVHPITGQSGLPIPPFVEDGSPPPSNAPWTGAEEEA